MKQKWEKMDENLPEEGKTENTEGEARKRDK